MYSFASPSETFSKIQIPMSLQRTKQIELFKSWSKTKSTGFPLDSTISVEGGSLELTSKLRAFIILMEIAKLSWILFGILYIKN